MLEVTILLKEFRVAVRDLESHYHKFSKAELKKILSSHHIDNAPPLEYDVDAPPLKSSSTSADSILMAVVGMSSPPTKSEKSIINFHIKADRVIDMMIALQHIALSKYRQLRKASAAIREHLGDSLPFEFGLKISIFTIFVIWCVVSGVEKKALGGRELEDEAFAFSSTYRDRRANALARGMTDDDGTGRWLDVLLRKFHVECSHVLHLEHDTGLLMSLMREEAKGGLSADRPQAPSAEPDRTFANISSPLPTDKLVRPRLDHFSAFLSCCAVGDVALCSRREVQALTKV